MQPYLLPVSFVGAQRGLSAFGQLRQLIDGLLRYRATRMLCVIDSLAPRFGDRGDIGRATLAAFDLDRGNTAL